jgi:homoserine dehydrogenase
MNDAPLKVGLLGCGTVGSQVARLLTTQREELALKIGKNVELAQIAVRDLARPRPGLDPALFTADAQALTARGDLDIVVELIGGIEPAGSLVKSAIAHGASVVTANKALLGQEGDQLFAAADAAGVDLYFEAAVAGAIPIVRPLRSSLVGDEITKVMGIVNGTTNYILDQMSEQGTDFATALAQAQELGYAEADPTADVEGFDAASKDAILASLAFHTWVSSDQVYREGITKITQADIQAAKRAGCVLKLLAVAQLTADGKVEARVHPAMVPLDHPLASVRDAYNAIFLTAREAGRLMFLGPGAGGSPTASAVIGDLVTVARNRARGVAGPKHLISQQLDVAPMSQTQARYYLRFSVVDQPGILSAATAILGEHGVSVRTMQQTGDQADDGVAELGMMTHQAKEGDLQACVADLRESWFIRSDVQVIRVEGM